MFQNTYIMYHYIKNKEESNYSMLIAIMEENEQGKKKNDKVEDSRDKIDKNQPLLQNMNIPYDLNEIQPRATQVWNCDDIMFYPNGRWEKVVCTYKLFSGEQMWNVKNGE